MPKTIIGTDAKQVAGVHGHAAHPRRTDEHGRAARDGEHVVADASGRAGGHRGGGEGGAGDGQERQAGLEGAVAADALQVLGHEEEEADQDGVE
jgi:hypothetical protein